MKIIKFGHIYEEGGVIMAQGFSVAGPEMTLLSEQELARQILTAIIERLRDEIRGGELRMQRTNIVLHDPHH